MLLVAAILTICKHSHLSPARSSRLAFSRALSKIEPGWPRVPGERDTVVISSGKPREWTQADVKRILGAPDVVRQPFDGDGDLALGQDEAWCYGTNGPHTMATLGTVVFSKGKVESVIGGYGKPPAASDIGESELLAAMRFMFRRPGNPENDADPLRYIQVANMLVSKGQKKTLAILGEYARVSGDGQDGAWLYWLVRVAFTSKLPDGVFPVPIIGAISPASPKNLKSWPTYPVAIVNQVHFTFVSSIVLAGVPEDFGWYQQDHRKEWVLRKNPIAPPDDPFPAYLELKASSVWKLVSADGMLTRSDYDPVLAQVLSLVKDAYQPGHAKGEYPSAKTSDFDRFHREFLSRRCRWDRIRQTYVRSDGSGLR